MGKVYRSPSASQSRRQRTPGDVTKTRSCDHPGTVSEVGGDGSGAGETGSFASPSPASGRAAIPAPQGPVTGLSKVAGLIILLTALPWIAVGGDWLGIVDLVGLVIMVIAIVQLIAGIGILAGSEGARVIGIVYSFASGAGLLVGFRELLMAINDDTVFIDALTSAPGFVLYAYSFIVLWLRWRRPATT